MDLKARIRRRQRGGGDARLILDYDAISPVAHVEEPVGRGPVLELLLDYLDPVFTGELPPDAYVWGPPGTGKSAIVTALFDGLRSQLSRSGSVIHTSTRAASATDEVPDFVYVDSRAARSDFALLHAVLDRLLDERVPEKGVGTDTLRDKLRSALRPLSERLVVAVDHIGEPGAPTLDDVRELLAPVDDSVAWIVVGRTPPDDIQADLPPERIEVPPYRDHALVDVLTSRASDGLAQRALGHEQSREIATWAEGNAHDALAALFGAADHATAESHQRVQNDDLTTGIMDVPRPCASLGRVLALPPNRQRVLRALVDLPDGDRGSVDSATDAIVRSPRIDLSAGTVKRFVYELAEAGIVERVREETTNGHGRPPSRVEPSFPTRVFRRLHDLQQGER
jgi:Cdc6-like AAA superfamily ATPase